MTVLADWIEFNPPVKLEKGKVYPFVSMDVVKPGRRYVTAKDERPYSGGGAKFCNGDTLFARITPCLQNGKISQFVNHDALGSGFGSTEFIVLRAIEGKSDPAFVYYLSQTRLLRETAINSMVGASGRQRADVTVLRDLEIKPPSLDVQKMMAKTLSTYDDLIENNQRRIVLLEESVRQVYRQWFIKFSFPGRTLSPDVSVIPSGWKMKCVGEYATFLNRGITPKYDDNADGLVVNQKCIRAGLLNLTPARRQSKEVNPEKLIQLGDILINSTGAGTLGRVAVVRSSIANCTVDTHVTIVRPSNPASASYLGLALLELEKTLETMGKGATNQLELSRVDIGSIHLVEPPQKLQEEFHQLVWPMLEQSEILTKMNQKLAEARDELLPKLMSGELSI